MDEEDEPITIDHLVGVRCILNASVHVELRKNRHKENRIELYTDDSHHCLLVGVITDLTADGGFIITLCNRRGEVLSDKAVLIAESLFTQKTRKGATV